MYKNIIFDLGGVVVDFKPRDFLMDHFINKKAEDEVYDLTFGRTYLFEAKDVFDSYCIYLEWNRAPEKKFYQPRRKVLKTVANALFL